MRRRPAAVAPPEANARAVRPIVSLVDDDVSVRESLADLVAHLGFDVRVFASAADFLACDAARATRCLLLDVAMPGMSGPGLQREMLRRGDATPIVFISAHADEVTRRQLMDTGAVSCLFKPIQDEQLLAALNAAIATTS